MRYHGDKLCKGKRTNMADGQPQNIMPSTNTVGWQGHNNTLYEDNNEHTRMNVTMLLATTMLQSTILL